MEKYFNKFPQFVYRGKNAIDITRCIQIKSDQRNNIFNFYPFELRDELRSDQVAEFYYNDPELDWLVYHINGVIDPYYEWYNNDYVFNSMIAQKYGSAETAIKRVKFYRNNWVNDDRQITPSQWQSNIPDIWKKYFEPIWGQQAEIISYKRKADDTTTNTNRILRYNINYTSGNTFIKDEIIDIKLLGLTVGGGEVEYSNSSTLSIRSVYGNTVANSTVTVTLQGESSNTTATSSAFVTVIENLKLDEEVFWSPVSYYAYELEKNEARKHINLINNEIASVVVNQIEDKLAE